MDYTLYASATPNGRKVPILLEELGVSYRIQPIRLNQKEQKEAWFLQLNPNGRIPVLVDHTADDFSVFESGAILVYLAEKHQQFMGNDLQQKSRTLQWLMWQMSGLGPMMGQAAAFGLHAPEKIPYAIERYQKETERLLGVMGSQLERWPYLAESYSIADMACYPWVSIWSKISEGAVLPEAVMAWQQRLEAREAVQKGMQAIS
jgi:glutathione S-transferase